MRTALRLTTQKQKAFVPREFDEQCTVFDWARRFCRLEGAELLFATLNGIRLPMSLAVKAKRAGNAPGVPDIILDAARGGYHGLRIEMKRVKGGTLSQAQKDWHQNLIAEGYKVITAKGAQEAIDAIKAYLENKFVRG